MSFIDTPGGGDNRYGSAVIFGMHRLVVNPQ